MKRFYSLFLSALFGIWGTQVGAQDLSTTEIDGVTYYEIGSAADLLAFADLVNGGEEGLSANAVLTADIDLTNATVSGTWETPIGAAGLSYAGIFDGQGHKITGFVTECAIDGSGLFGYTSNATIKNFSIEGELTSTAGTGSGVIGYPSNSTIYNVHSSLEITVPTADVHHVGGVVGSARGGNTISHCTFSGAMTVAAGSTDNFAGVVAYIGGDSITFCANYGTISFEDVGCAAGGVTGYLNNTGSYVQNCLNMGSLVCTEPDATPKWGGAIVGRLRTHDTTKLTGNCWLEGSATGAGKDNNGAINLTQAFAFSRDKLGTGEVCYKLNGDQSVIGWYQTINEDPLPVLDATHAQVFMAGRLHCNGDVYEGATYTNENTEVIQDEHNFVDGFCSYCGLFNENFLTPNADGFYEIANAKQLVWFEQVVNRGAFDANAILTADIDFAELIDQETDPVPTEVAWTPIGDWGQIRGTTEARYKGHFDGQGHKILNFNVTSTCNYYGIFGVISEGSLIENFDIFGTLNLGHKTGGVVGYSRDTACTIRNIHSYLTLNVTEAATTAERPGGIIGSAVNGTTNIENCTYSGTLNAGGHTGNIGGIVGYINNNAAAIVNITNCLFDGEILNGDTADGQCGGIVGYNNGGKATIKNCLSIGAIVSSEGNIGQLIGRLNGSNTTFANNYYKGDFVNGTKSGKTAKGEAPVQVTTDELLSGEVAWKLNGETFLDVVWRQTLDEDKYPKPYGNGAVVYQTPTGYDCIDENDPESFEAFINSVIANEEEFLNDLVAYQALIDEYKEAIESWKDINTYEEFLAAYKAAAEMKEGIQQSVVSYQNYQKACEDAAAYLTENNLEGEWATLLQTYLQEEAIEPSADYPNGSYAYIMENLNLDDEALAAEIDFVNQMLQNAIAGGITSGTEITRLLTNPGFVGGSEGWEREGDDGIGFARTEDTAPLPLLRGLGYGSFNVSQTLNELTNGIYMVAANGMFRNGTDYTAQFYAGQLYLNGTANYIMSPSDDVLPTDKAEDKVNCYLDKDELIITNDGKEGYVPTTLTGCSYAFNAGRYLNVSATEVTDGTLTVGLRSLGASNTSDWMPFGNVHLWYLGTADEANKKLTGILDAFAKRAATIVNYEGSDLEDYSLYPFMSEELKGQLSYAIDGTKYADTGEKKMELINTFSDLFNQVHANRKAYIAMFEAAGKLFDLLDVLLGVELITDDEYNEWQDKVYAAEDHYRFGDVTTEEALAITQELNIIDQMLPSVDGVYQLATPTQVKLFSMLVNNGEAKAKAVLTNDIDMAEVVSEDGFFEPIGTSSNPFEGEFDGQGHKISNFGLFVVEDEETGDGYYTLQYSAAKDSNGGGGEGFFGLINGATVKNFSIDGAFEVTGGNYKGTIGQSWKSTISNVHSAINIAITASSCHHCGGLVGSSEGGSGSTITNCSYSGTLTIAEGSTDNFAGILGYSGGDAVKNCANYGTINFTSSGCAAGGVVGYINNTTTSIQNCLNVGSLHCTTSDSPKYGGAIVGRIKNNWGADVIVNNYWLAGSAYAPAKKDDGTSPLAASAEGSTAEQLASGEICYALNGDQEEINWFQTLGEDTYPTLDDSHKVVLYSENKGYYNDGGIDGDLNGDGKVDIADAVTVLDFMARGDNDPAADLNGDGKIDIADFVTVLDIMAQQ